MKKISLLLIVLVGCHKATVVLPKTIPLGGTIRRANGQPLPQGRVVLTPFETAEGIVSVECFGDITNGRFTLTTYHFNDGAIPGKYTVSIQPFNFLAKSGSPVKLKGERIPPKYQDPSTSKLVIEVLPNSTTLNLTIE